MTRRYITRSKLDLDVEKLSKNFSNLRPIKKGVANSRGKYSDVFKYHASKGWKEDLHYLDVGPVPVFDSKPAQSRFASSVRYYVGKAVDGEYQISYATGRLLVFRTASSERAVDITSGPSTQTCFSTEDSSYKRAIVDPYFASIPSTEGLAICLPNYYHGPVESDIHRLLRAGFPRSKILAVERDKKTYEALQLQTRGRIRVVLDEIENVIKEETEPISFYYPDYCGWFNEACVRGLVGLSGKLTDSARVMTTFSRGHDNGQYRKPFLELVWAKLFKFCGIDFYFGSLADQGPCVWVTLVIAHTLGMGVREFIDADKIKVPKVGYRLEVQGFHRYTGLGNQGMEFDVIDLHRVQDPLDHFPQMLGNLVHHTTSLVTQGSS